jgi:hypothetical protein
MIKIWRGQWGESQLVGHEKKQLETQKGARKRANNRISSKQVSREDGVAYMS